MTVRPMAVAGTFYPENPQNLVAVLRLLLESAPKSKTPGLENSRIFIVPHAGYVYSGNVAAAAYALIDSPKFKHVVLFGPSHHVGFSGIVAPSVDFCATPIGEIPVDTEIRKHLLARDLIQIANEPHREEHSLEVQFPFLRQVLGECSLLPLAMGYQQQDTVEKIITELWEQEDILFLFSSDLSHFHPYAEASEIDQNTIKKIAAKDPSLDGEEACGCVGINGLIQFAEKRKLQFRPILYQNSGDSAGDKDSVVGYLSAAFL